MAPKLRPDAKGSAQESRGRFLSLIPLGGGDRFERVCPSATSKADAAARAEQGTAIVRALYAGGKEAFVRDALAQLVDAPPGDVEAIVASWLAVGGMAIPGAAGKPAEPPAPTGNTFRAFAEEWIGGDLHKRFPDHVGALQPGTVGGYRAKLTEYVYPVVRETPLAAFTLDLALEVMRKVPPTVSTATRRHVAQVMYRSLALAAFPARLIKATPLPRGFLPKLGPGRAKGFLYPDEEAAALAFGEVALATRMLLGFLAREGCRKEEAAALQWGDGRSADAASWIDMKRGWAYLDQHKTAGHSGAREWPLDPGVLEALRRWRKIAPPGPFVFGGERALDAEPLPQQLRACVEGAGVERAELFESTSTRRRLVAHDLRGVFTTIALARGRDEGWIMRRTGWTTSAMLARYRRQAANLAEGEDVTLVPLYAAIPELRRPGEGGTEPVSEPVSGDETAGDEDRERAEIPAGPASCAPPQLISDHDVGRAGAFRPAVRS